jgi:prepilin-type N-terminal cleavage/methylation domain-containing protein
MCVFSQILNQILIYQKEKSTMKKNKGFSLIELLIVVAIILIIAAIAIPNLVKARRSANEGSATASMRTLGSAQMLYKSTIGAFAGSIGGLSAENLIDNVLGAGTKSGYSFATSYGGTPTLQFTASSAPLSINAVTGTGKRYFFTDETQVIRYKLDSAAASTDSAIGE